MDELIEVCVFAVPGCRNLECLNELKRPFMLADKPICISLHNFSGQYSLKFRVVLRGGNTQNSKEKGGLVLSYHPDRDIGRNNNDGHVDCHVTLIVGENLSSSWSIKNFLVDDVSIFMAWSRRASRDTATWPRSRFCGK